MSVPGSCFVPGKLVPLSTDPATHPQSPASEAETSWAKILWFCDPRNWFFRYLGNYQWRTSHLPAPWMRMWLEKPLFSHPTLYLVHHPTAQPRITHWDPFLPGILELQLTVLVHSASLRLVPTCASACPGFYTGILEDAPALPSLPHFIQVKTLPTSQIFPKAGISRKYYPKYM